MSETPDATELYERVKAYADAHYPGMTNEQRKEWVENFYEHMGWDESNE